MGHVYSVVNGRRVLDCDACGGNPARRIPCPFRVTYADGGSLPYCGPDALCAKCRPIHGTVAAHRANGCETGAARSMAREADRVAKSIAGVYVTVAAWGDWHETVPTDFVGVAATAGGLRGSAGAPVLYRLVPATEYAARNTELGYILRDDLAPWTDPNAN